MASPNLKPDMEPDVEHVVDPDMEQVVEPDIEHVDESLDGDDYDYDYDHVSRIAKIMDQIFENFEDHELTKFINIIREVGDRGGENDESQLKDLVVDFTNLTMFRRGISVNLIKQAVRSLMEMQQDPRLWKPVWDQVSRIAGKLNFSIIADFGELDEETLKKYLEVLKFGKENVRHIRLMMVGMFGVGKTTIIRRMCNEDVCNVKSTVGIDVSVNACEVDEKREWRATDVKEKEKREMHYKSRIRNANKATQPPKPEIPRPTAESTPVTHIVAETVEIDHTIDTDQHEEEYQQFEEDIDHDMHFPVSKPSKPSPKHTMTGFIEGIKKATKTKTNGESKFFDEVKEAVDDKTEAAPEKRITTVSIWDFAGQSVYYSTHHFFLSSRAIYLLVLNISKQLSDPVPEDDLGDEDCDNRATSMPKGFTCLDAFKFWMNSIYTYTAARKDGSKAYLPKIVLVGTFKDQVGVKNKEKYKEDYFQEALESFTGSEVIKLVHEKKFFVSKDDPDEIFNTLKNELLSIAENQVFWNEEVPLKWMPLERSIEVRKGDPFSTDNTKTDDQSSIMELNELVQIDKDTEFPLDDTKQLKVFLWFQHALGNVLYYDTKELEETIILNPQWILNVFKLFVAHARDKKPELISEWQNFEKNAILSGPLIDELVKQSDDATFAKYKKEIIQFMEHLDVIAKPITYSQDRSEESSSDDEDEDQHTKCRQPWQNKTEDFYIVPCLLSVKPPEDEPKHLVPPNVKSTPILCLVFKNKFLPSFVCHRLMATCIRQWELPVFKKKQRMVFNGMGRFFLSRSKTSWLTMWWKDHIIYMQVSRCTNKEKPVDGRSCSNVRRCIQQMIRQLFSIHRNFTGEVGENQNVQYIEHIKCPKCHNTQASVSECCDDEQTRMIPVSKFRTYDEVNCDHGHTMGRDAALSRWYFEKNEERKIVQLHHLRREMFEWFESNPDNNGEVTEANIAELSGCIGKEYIALGIELGLPFSTIEQTQMDEKDVRTCIKSMLYKWKRDSVKEPTIGFLKSAIMNILGIYYKDGKYRQKSFDKKNVVAWFDSHLKPVNPPSDVPTPSDAQAVDVVPPSERELLEVTHFINGKYRRLAKRLFQEHMSYVDLECIEEKYSLDFNRVLAVLLLWKKKKINFSFDSLKAALEKLLQITWEDVRQEIETDGSVKDMREDDNVLRAEGVFENHRDAEFRDRKRAEFKLHDDEKGAYSKQDTHTHDIDATAEKDVYEGNTSDGQVNCNEDKGTSEGCTRDLPNGLDTQNEDAIDVIYNRKTAASTLSPPRDGLDTQNDDARDKASVDESENNVKRKEDV